MKDLRERLIKSFQEGNLIEILNKESINQNESIGQYVAQLHNEGCIDVISEFSKISNNVNEIDFYDTITIFEDTLPHINSQILPIITCIKHLSNEIGETLDVNSLLNPFIDFCKKDDVRPKEIIEIIESNPDEWIDFLAPTIIAGADLNKSDYLNIALRLLNHDNFKIRKKIIFVLGRIDYNNEKLLIDASYNSLKHIINSEKDGNIIAAALKSLFYIYLADKSLEEDVTNLFQITLYNKDNLSLFPISEIFRFNTNNIPPILLDVIINSLKNSDPNDIDLLKNIDRGLKQLKKNNQDEKVYYLLEYLLVKNKSILSITTFENFSRELYRDNIALSKIATKWFLSKEISLCKAVKDIVRLGHGSDILLFPDFEQLKHQDQSCSIYLAKKAIGWLYSDPISCMSFIIPLVEYTDQLENEKITNLLFNPMLISFPGRIMKYLEKIKPNSTEKIQSVIETIFKFWESYVEGLRTADVLPELFISEYHKAIYSKSLNREMEEAMKVSEKSFFIYELFPKKVLLYGRKSIYYSPSNSDKPNRNEIVLQNINQSMEFPRLDTLDPHNLDYILRSFRIENCTL